MRHIWPNYPLTMISRIEDSVVKAKVFIVFGSCRNSLSKVHHTHKDPARSIFFYVFIYFFFYLFLFSFERAISVKKTSLATKARRF